MKIVVVDYGSGNLTSAARALERAAAESGIPAKVVVSGEPTVLATAERIVLPGQGAFADCAAGLAGVPGLWDALEQATADGTPFLGICVGMQLMAERGLEHRPTPGFGWIRGEIAAMEAATLPLPQMSWNALQFRPDHCHPLLAGLTAGQHVYFVHSYALHGADAEEVVATTDYGGEVVAMVARANRAGTQFHVEKSQRVGLRILANFLSWAPSGAVERGEA